MPVNTQIITFSFFLFLLFLFSHYNLSFSLHSFVFSKLPQCGINKAVPFSFQSMPHWHGPPPLDLHSHLIISSPQVVRNAVPGVLPRGDAARREGRVQRPVPVGGMRAVSQAETILHHTSTGKTPPLLIPTCGRTGNSDSFEPNVTTRVFLRLLPSFHSRISTVLERLYWLDSN